jgi:lysyl-tRNA synthetase, class II
MKFLEEMIKKLFTHVIKKKDFTYQTKSISIKKPFKKMSFADALRQYALLNDTVNIKKDDLIITAKRLGVDANSTKDKSKLLDEIFKKAARPHLIQPTFVYDWPKSLLPLAKRKEGEDDVAESFQLYIGGLEILKGFTELNDPIDQRRRFEEQEALRSDGDKEAQYLDEDYIKNLELGLPPTAGFGLGIDRLALLLTDTRNIREVILFPTLRPKT